MSIEVIVGVAVVALIIVLALAFALPRVRERSSRRRPTASRPPDRPVAAERRAATAVRHQRDEATAQHTAIVEGEAIRARVEAQLHDESTPAYPVASGLAGERRGFVAAHTASDHLDAEPVIAEPAVYPGGERERFVAAHAAPDALEAEPVVAAPVAYEWDLEASREGHAVALELQAIAARSRASRMAGRRPAAALDPRAEQAAPAPVARRRRLRSAGQRRAVSTARLP